MPGDRDDPPSSGLLPPTPPAPSLPPVEAPSSWPADGAAKGDLPPGEVTDGAPDPLPGERLATRNIPPPPPAAPTVAAVPLDQQDDFILPEIESMGSAVTAVLVGRVLFAVAALLIGLAARRSTGVGGGERAEAFWSVVGSAGVLTLVGLVGLAFWSATLAGNARRLRARTASGRAMGWSWALPVGWVAISSLTYLRIDVDADFDPLPGIAAIGWMIALTVPYGRLQGVFRGLSRTPPLLWITAFPLDLFAFGLVWWRLTSWPEPVGQEADRVELTADIAFGAAALLAVNILVFVWLANKAGNGVYERLGRLEAPHRPDDEDPDWFRSGLAARQALAQPVVNRPLVATKHLASVVAALHVLWGVALVGFGLLIAGLAFAYSSDVVFVGDELAVDDADAGLIALSGGIVGVAYVAAIVSHGIWAALTAINARRVTVHSPNPGTFVIAFAPAPILLVAGLVIGGRAGYWLVAAGLTVGFAALILVNQMLLALSGRVGRQLHGFSRWTLCLTAAYVAGFVLNLLFSQSTSQLGVYAALSLVQGVLIALGGIIGYSSMHDLEDELRSHRHVQRADD